MLSCSLKANIGEREMLLQKVNAFQFLSKYHHQLHVIIGEEEGDIGKAFSQIFIAFSENNNPELLPVREAVIRVKRMNKNFQYVKRLDFLVDYYQSGLSMQIEGIMRGYGFLDSFSFEDSMNIYDSIQK